MATINGNNNNETLVGTATADSISGFGGNDSLDGGDGNDTLRGGTGDDTLRGGNGNDILDGTSGADVFIAGTGSDNFNGGAISDRANYSDGNRLDYSGLGGSITVNLSGLTSNGNLGTATITKSIGGVDTLLDISEYWLTAGADSVLGSSANIFELFVVFGGNDTINGGVITSSPDPANGNRVSFEFVATPVTVNLLANSASYATFTLTLTNINEVRGGSGADALSGSDVTLYPEYFDGGAGNDTINGRGGFDGVSYDTVPAAVNVDLGAGTASDGLGDTDTLQNIEQVIGSALNDTLRGSSGADVLEGHLGDDLIIFSGGSDTLDGDAGQDTLSFAGQTAPVTVFLNVYAIVDGTNNSLAGFEAVIGGTGNDTISLTDGSERASGGAGNDLISAGYGSDTLAGEAGNDTLEGGFRFDRYYSRDGNLASYASATLAVSISLDAITGDGNQGTVVVADGQGGTDTLFRIAGLIGSAHNDSLTGSRVQQDETLEGGAGDDTLDGGSFSDMLLLSSWEINRASYLSATAAVTVNLAAGTASGGAGNDTLININGVMGGAGNDTLTGSDRSDHVEHFWGSSGNDNVNGAGGTDLLRYDLAGVTGGVTADLALGTASDGQGGSDVFSNIEGLVGSAQADSLRGSTRTDVAEFFMGNAGNDTIDGRGGRDVVSYASGLSGVTVRFGAFIVEGFNDGTASDGLGGTDVLRNIEGVVGSPHTDLLIGSAGSGTPETFEGSGGNDTIAGLSGSDLADYWGVHGTQVTVDLLDERAWVDGSFGIDEIYSIEHVRGSQLYGDFVYGDFNDNSLEGAGGDDALYGRGGNDTLTPGTGNETVEGGADFDTLVLAGNEADYGKTIDGFNRLVFTHIASQKVVTAADVESVQFADVTRSEAVLRGQTANTPSDLADVLTGTTGAETLDGLLGHDQISGGAGNDSLGGGEGNDTLLPGAGHDTVDGGDDVDTLRLEGNRSAYTVSTGVGFDLRLTTIATGDVITVINIERIIFNATTVGAGQVLNGAVSTPTELGDVSVYDSSANRLIMALGGHDWVRGGIGSDTIIGGMGDDTLDGGLRYSESSGEDDTGIDWVSYEDATGPVTINLNDHHASGGAGNDVLLHFENVRAGGFSDLVLGDGRNNSIEGSAGDDTLVGLAGDDTMVGGRGDDVFDGGDGNDVVSYEFVSGAVSISLASSLTEAGGGFDGEDDIDTLVLGSAELLIGSAFGDRLTGSPLLIQAADLGVEFHRYGDDFIVGRGGDDTIRGLTGNDTLDGGDGNDSLVGTQDDIDAFANAGALDGEETNTLRGGSGDDTLVGTGGFSYASYASAFNNVMVDLVEGIASDGEGGSDTLVDIRGVVLSRFSDQVIGDAHDNRFISTDYFSDFGEDFPDNDAIDGGDGFDFMSYADSEGNVFVSLQLNLAQSEAIGQDTLISIEGVEGTTNDDSIRGDSADNLLIGNDGQDTLEGSFGSDSVQGGAGQDQLYGGEDDDWLDGGAGDDTMDGGTGIDWVDYSHYDNGYDLPPGQNSPGVELNLANSIAFGDGTDSLFDVENARGSAFDDDIAGTTGANHLRGGTGNDTLAGDDGIDTLDGGDGFDLIDYFDVAGNVTVSLATGSVLDGFGNADSIVGIEGVSGSATGNDELLGNSASNLLMGHGGIDSLAGAEGDDTLDAGVGAGTVDGGAGNDRADLIGARADYTVTLIGATEARFESTLHNVNLLVRDVETLRFADGDRSFAQAIDTTTGTGGNDSISGGNADESLRGLEGNDTLVGNGGNDTLDGGNGNDSLLGNDGDDRLVPGAGTDRADGGAGSDTLLLGSTQASYTITPQPNGDVRVVGSGQDVSIVNVEQITFSDATRSLASLAGSTSTPTVLADTLIGTNGNDSIDALAGNDSVNGGAGNDTLLGGADNDTLVGFTGSDLLNGGTGNDSIVADTNDTVIGGAGSDSIDGGDLTLLDYRSATAAISFTGPSADTQRGSVDEGSGNVDSLSPNRFNLYASNFGDVLIGGTDTASGSATPWSNDILYGQGGNDTLIGRGGNDYLDGDEGNDSIAGAEHDDQLRGGVGNDTLDGGSGDDIMLPGDGSDSLIGGGGLDEVYYDNQFDPVNVDMPEQRVRKANGQSTDTIIGFEGVVGTLGPDTMLGDAGNNSLTGGRGDDTLNGGAGHDNLRGGDQNDSLLGGLGDDTLEGEAGDDRLLPGDGDATVNGGSGTDVMVLGVAREAYQVRLVGQDLTLIHSNGDRIILRELESIQFSDQTLTEQALRDQAGQTVTGNAGNNTLVAAEGNDTLLGLDGDDVLDGGDGNDRLDGGEGYDVAKYSGSAPITADLQTNTVQRVGGTDTLVSIEIVFGSSTGDILNGRAAYPATPEVPTAPNARQDTLRGNGGNDQIDGGTGVDSAEWLGARSDYVLTRVNETTWTVRDNNLSNGDEGTDTVSNIERFVFADGQLAFGPRAEELARVAMVLWGPGILASSALFCRGFSFYDVGHSFELMSRIALQFWGHLNDTQLAATLKANSGTSKTEAQLLATLAAAGGDVLGRAAMVREAALDDAVTSLIVAPTGIRNTGVFADHFAESFGFLSGLTPGS